MQSVIQYCICLAVAVVMYLLERSIGSVRINAFITEQGLIILAALIALSYTSITFLIARLNDLEKEGGKPNFFDETKIESLYCIKEQGVMFALLFATIAFTPEMCWDNSTSWYVCVAPCTIARACIFQALYATYDFIRATVESSIAR